MHYTFEIKMYLGALEMYVLHLLKQTNVDYELGGGGIMGRAIIVMSFGTRLLGSCLQWRPLDYAKKIFSFLYLCNSIRF